MLPRWVTARKMPSTFMAKRRLREIDRRVRYLRKRLEAVKVVDELPANQDKVYFGAWVELIDEEEQLLKIRLVGPG